MGKPNRKRVSTQYRRLSREFLTTMKDDSASGRLPVADVQECI